LRAIKSVLVVAGSLKREDPERAEDQVLMRALRDFNVPKIVTDDMPVFMGLIGDLFPALDVPRKVNPDFEKQVRSTVLDLKLQAEDDFVLKVVQLHELLAVRHSVFVIGNAGTGKSQVLKSLYTTYKNIKLRPVWTDLNPKAVTNDELFGIVHPATREWKDGLFSSIMRDLANITHDGPKWIVLDGDIDPMWIESLNTVMDDNKVLTLASNERIPLKPSMRLIFEISHLRTATPATVSRAGSHLFVIPACYISERMCEKIRVSSAGSLFCVLSNPAWILVISSFLFVGILYINPGDLGWNPQVFSWIKEREHQTERANLILLFDKYVPSCLDALRTR
uniref:Dynein heavy chain hydrolytic ATP-binding dynein motor region domain-containing protein n=1 Tax=Oryzias latipes TaxID=8090 RepID=A0A3P9LBQ8_ORYLA